jgi:hypothetical protein
MACNYALCDYPVGECRGFCDKDFKKLRYEKAVHEWNTHDPFKRASPELMKIIEDGLKYHRYAEEALL